MTKSFADLWTGTWDYRAYRNWTFDQEQTPPDGLDFLFGSGSIILEAAAAPNRLRGTIGDVARSPDGWQLELSGSFNYGDPFTARFQGRGEVGGNPWLYEYVGYLVNPWQNGIDQVPAIVGSVIRGKKHPGDGGHEHPAGVVASFFAVKT